MSRYYATTAIVYAITWAALALWLVITPDGHPVVRLILVVAAVGHGWASGRAMSKLRAACIEESKPPRIYGRAS